MDFTSLLAIVVAIVVIYFFIKFIVNPALKVVGGIIVFFIIIYILQHYLNFNFNNILGPFGLNWILSPINYYINQIISFLRFAWGNVPKNVKITPFK